MKKMDEIKPTTDFEKKLLKTANEYADEYFFEHTEIAAEAFKEGARWAKALQGKKRTAMMYRED